MTTHQTLDISLYPIDRAPGLTEAHYLTLAECAALSLEEQGHSQESSLLLAGTFKTSHPLAWEPVTPQILSSWADPTEAMEKGACAIAMAIVFEKTDYLVVERAAKRTGFDYWLGQNEADETDIFAQTARLEVSGIRKGTDAQLERRCKEKVDQLQTSNTDLRGFAVVVEFSLPQARIARR